MLSKYQLYSLPKFISLTQKKPLLALDISKSKVGMALTDNQQAIALPLKTIIRNKLSSDLTEIYDIYQEYQCGGIIMGYPIYNDDDHNPKCQAVRDFSRRMCAFFARNDITVPIWLQDESYSTLAAQEQIKSTSLSKSQAELRIDKWEDAYAAAFFLQSFLNNKEALKHRK